VTMCNALAKPHLSTVSAREIKLLISYGSIPALGREGTRGMAQLQNGTSDSYRIFREIGGAGQGIVLVGNSVIPKVGKEGPLLLGKMGSVWLSTLNRR